MSNFQLISEWHVMAKSQVVTQRLQVMLALRTHAFLELLAQKGTYGVNGPDVAKGLIEKGIRDAIKEGGLTPEDVRSVQSPK
jgi:hypothetical protein